MKIGVKLHHSGFGANPEMMKKWTLTAEKLGFHLISVADHIGLTPEVIGDYPDPYYEVFTNLAWLAGLTTNIELNTSVVVIPYRHPITTAHLVANVDQLSGGRFIFGVGVGWAKTEFDALGISFSKRGKLTDEYLKIMKLLWTNDSISYKGEYIQFKDIKVSPKPIQKPHPPIWVGGQSKIALKRAVLLGEAWHPIGITTNWLKTVGIPLLSEMAKKFNKPIPQICPRIFCRITQTDISEEHRIAGEGTLDQIRRDFEVFYELGCSYLILDTKRNNPTANTDEHYDDAWSTLSLVADKLIDLKNKSLR